MDDGRAYEGHDGASGPCRQDKRTLSPPRLFLAYERLCAQPHCSSFVQFDRLPEGVHPAEVECLRASSSTSPGVAAPALFHARAGCARWRRDMDRGERRRRTQVIGCARRALRLRAVHGWDVSAARPRELSAWNYAQCAPLGCRCRKRKRGQPRRDAGFCKNWRGRIYAARRQWREWGRAAARGLVDAAAEPQAPRE